MSTYVVRIETANAAFEDNMGGEIARILVKLAAQISDGVPASDEIRLRDANGNMVGVAMWEQANAKTPERRPA